MIKLLLVIKIVIYSLVYVRAFQEIPLSLPLAALALALFTCDFLRNVFGYHRFKLNIISFLLSIILALIFSWFSNKGSFDKLCLLYVIEEIAVLPKPYAFAFVPLTLLISIFSSILYDISGGGQVQVPGFAEILLNGLVIILVLSERMQREQRLAYERLSKELRYLNQRLQESLAWNEDLASAAERRRIAAEIHDSLGHNLTGLILTLEAGKKLVNQDVEAGKVYLDKALQAARAALHSVRELVAEKKDTHFEFELASHLQEMVQEVQQITDLQIDVDIQNWDTGLSGRIQFHLYRIFQEAITNTLRHSKADRAQIILAGNGELILFSYRDDGLGTSKIEAGNGLNGMQERLSSLGGTISFYSQPGHGFRIEGCLDRRGKIYEEDKNTDC